MLRLWKTTRMAGIAAIVPLLALLVVGNALAQAAARGLDEPVQETATPTPTDSLPTIMPTTPTSGTATPSVTGTAMDTATPGDTGTPTPSNTGTPSGTGTPLPTGIPTGSATPGATDTPATTMTPSGTMTPTGTATPSMSATPAPTATYVGRLGALVTVADGCSHYPLTQCDGTVIEISPRSPDILAARVGQFVRVETTVAECGRGIAGQPLYGPVADNVQAAAPCPMPTSTPVVLPSIPPPTSAVPTPDVAVVPCPFLTNRVPAAAVNAAVGNPSMVYGYGLLCNPAVRPSPFNNYRTRLSLLVPGKPYHPTYNSLVLKCGCP